MNDVITFSTWSDGIILNNATYDPNQSTLKNDKLALQVVNLERELCHSLEKNIIVDRIIK